MSTRRDAMTVLVLTLLAAAGARAETPCPPDVDCSGAVDVDDLVEVVLQWGRGQTPADVDRSGVVDVDDLLEVILEWGPCVFAYGPPVDDAEVLQISLELLGAAGPLQAPPSILQRVEQDLAAIRAAVPALADQVHSPQWSPVDLIVQRWQDEDHAEYDCTNTYYQVVDEHLLFSSGGADWLVLTFAGPLNVPALVQVYDALEAIGVSEPNALVGGQNAWSPQPLVGDVWRWQIDDGWLDCFDGCDCHRAYVIETTPSGEVEVLSVDEFGQPWCEF